MDANSFLIFGIGLVFVIAGAEALVRGASRLAALFGVSPLIIGLTVVAYGTGSPELAVALRASSVSQPDLAVGNVVGSNIFNVLCILGLSALIVPVVVHDQLVRLDVPIMVLASGMLFFLSLDGNVGAFDGILLLGSLIAYTTLLIKVGRRQRAVAMAAVVDIPDSAGRWAWVRYASLIVAGIGMLIVGSRWLVHGAVQLAQLLGMSELVIGLTIVAVGTSLPEIATSIIAGLRGERDIAVGNVVGSNIYNICAVLGVAGVLSPGGLDVAAPALRFDIPVMFVVAIACLPIFFARSTVTRWEGALFLGYWIAYTAYLVLDASQHDAVNEYRTVMTLFVIPLTLITMAVVLYREFRSRQRKSSGSGGSPT